MKKEILLVSSIVLIAVLLGLSLLTYGQLWYGDFAAYIMQARSLLNGTMDEFVRQNAFTIHNSTLLVGPVTYPWGYPTILAPVYALFGLKPIYLKLPTLGFFALFLVSFFLLLRRRLNLYASVLLTAVTGFSPALLSFQDQILSDIPFLCFSTLSLFLIDVILDHQSKRMYSWRWNLLLGLVIFGAFFIRTNGILLLPVLALSQFGHFLWPNRDWRSFKQALVWLALPYLAFGLLAVITLLVFPGGQGSYFSHYSLLDSAKLIDNLTYYATLMADFFSGLPLQVWVYLVALAFFLAGIVVTIKTDFSWLVYLVLTLLIFLTWPEPQGLRFLFPLIPLFLYFSFQGMLWASAKLSARNQPVGRGFVFGWWGVIALLFLISSTRAAYMNLSGGRAINGPFDPYSNAMFEFVRQETPAQSVIVFFKPRVMQLMTGRDSLLIDQCSLLDRGDYVVINTKRDEKYGQVNPNDVPLCNQKLSAEPVFTNRRFIVYQVRK